VLIGRSLQRHVFYSFFVWFVCVPLLASEDAILSLTPHLFNDVCFHQFWTFGEEVSCEQTIQFPSVALEQTSTHSVAQSLATRSFIVRMNQGAISREESEFIKKLSAQCKVRLPLLLSLIHSH
jgi:hypothetical protein